MMRHIPIALIRIYQKWFSPLLPPACIYQPSCSHYAVAAIERYGAMRGSWMAAARLLRCHPFATGGYDPVPVRPEQQLAAPADNHNARCCPHHPHSVE
jgi:putative membrane protein insertion efficiency factor